MRTCLIALLVACPAHARDRTNIPGPHRARVAADAAVPGKR